MGTGTVSAKINYELGYEATIDGKHEKHTIVIDRKRTLRYSNNSRTTRI